MTTSNYGTMRAIILAAAIFALPSQAAAGMAVYKHNDVSYVSGGAGDEERSELEAMSGRFNLQITMALSSGHYVGDAKIRIQDSNGQAILDAVAEGPLFYAQLKPGAYNVIATLNGKEQKQAAQIGAGGRQHLKFTWPSE